MGRKIEVVAGSNTEWSLVFNTVDRFYIFIFVLFSCSVQSLVVIPSSLELVR